MKNIKLVVLGLAIILVGGIFTGCQKANVEDDKNTIKLGVTGNEVEVWNHVKEELAKDDIELEIVSFGDYTRPNLSLSEGEIDINSFQHYAFFDKFKEDHDLDITVLAETVIAPIGLYSTKIENVEDLEKGAKVAIPNDGTNGGRALILLQTAGILEVDPAAKNLPTLKDITSNPLEIEIIEVDAATTPRSLEDVALAAINSGVAVDAGFIPTEDAIFLEPVNDDSKPYINIFAVKTEDKDNPLYKKLVEVYHTDEVKDLIEKVYKGSQVPTW